MLWIEIFYCIAVRNDLLQEENIWTWKEQEEGEISNSIVYNRFSSVLL